MRNQLWFVSCLLILSTNCELHLEDTKEIILTYRKGHLGFTYEELGMECIPFRFESLNYIRVYAHYRKDVK